MFQALAGKSIIESCGMITTLQSRSEVCTSLSLVPAMQRLKDCPIVHCWICTHFCQSLNFVTGEFMFLKFPGCSECNVLPLPEPKGEQKHSMIQPWLLHCQFYVIIFSYFFFKPEICVIIAPLFVPRLERAKRSRSAWAQCGWTLQNLCSKTHRNMAVWVSKGLQEGFL